MNKLQTLRYDYAAADLRLTMAKNHAHRTAKSDYDPRTAGSGAPYIETCSCGAKRTVRRSVRNAVWELTELESAVRMAKQLLDAEIDLQSDVVFREREPIESKQAVEQAV